MNKEEIYLKSIPEINDKEKPLSFSKLEVLILLKGYKEQLTESKSEEGECEHPFDKIRQVKGRDYSCECGFTFKY